MSKNEAFALATRIAKESNGVSIKIGTTNGRPCLHLRNRDVRQSVTIFTASEWTENPWNFANRPKARKLDAASQEALAAATA